MNFILFISDLHPQPKFDGLAFIFDIIDSFIHIFNALYSNGLNTFASDEKLFLHTIHLYLISRGFNSLSHVLHKTLVDDMKYNLLLQF